jgi:hypothetical protein
LNALAWKPNWPEPQERPSEAVTEAEAVADEEEGVGK